MAKPTPNARTVSSEVASERQRDGDHREPRPGARGGRPPQRPIERVADSGAPHEPFASIAQHHGQEHERDAEDRREDADDRHRVQIAGAAERRVGAAEQQRQRPERGGGRQQVGEDGDDRKQDGPQREAEHQGDREGDREDHPGQRAPSSRRRGRSGSLPARRRRPAGGCAPRSAVREAAADYPSAAVCAELASLRETTTIWAASPPRATLRANPAALADALAARLRSQRAGSSRS